MHVRLDTMWKKVAAAASVLALITFAVSWYIATREAAVTDALYAQIDAQGERLVTLSTLIDTDGADETVNAIVRDCTPEERERFDYLLSNLQTLRARELEEVDGLFARCGSFYAERKAMMVSRLVREFEVYQDQIALLATLDSRTSLTVYGTDTWQQIVALEIDRARYMLELVEIQGSIIDLLRAGELVGSKNVADALTTAKQTKDNLSLAGVQLATLRQQLGAVY